MSDLPALHTKIDAIIAQMATRDELAAAGTAIRDELAAAVTATRGDFAAAVTTIHDELTEMRTQIMARIGQMATRDELTEMRTEIMARIDRVQDATTLQHHERVVDVASSERAERLAKAARDDATAIGEIVTPLIRVVHTMRTQLDDLAEQVRVLKEGRAA
jgi:hypothetical protein